MNDLKLAQLAERWSRLCERLVPAASTSTIRTQFERLVTSYSNPPLPYHNLDHIAACLRDFDEQRGDAHAPDQVEYALWLHDAIYDPPRRDNEARSADLAAGLAQDLGLPPKWIESCRGLILATRHADPPQTADQCLICDIDLAILAAPPEQYDRYQRAIRTEYAFVCDADYRAGRAQFLHKMLDRPHLFHTEHYRATAENAARTNIRRELAAYA